MEKAWEEFKKIEAQDKGREITKIAEQDAEKLLANSKTCAKEEALKNLKEP
jgi:hypothetical protein